MHRQLHNPKCQLSRRREQFQVKVRLVRNISPPHPKRPQMVNHGKSRMALRHLYLTGRDSQHGLKPTSVLMLQPNAGQGGHRLGSLSEHLSLLFRLSGARGGPGGWDVGTEQQHRTGSTWTRGIEAMPKRPNPESELMPLVKCHSRTNR